MDAPPAPVPGPRVHLPRMRRPPVRPCPSHRMVVEGGATDLENLTLACSFHHRLAHEHGGIKRSSQHLEQEVLHGTGARMGVEGHRTTADAFSGTTTWMASRASTEVLG